MNDRVNALWECFTQMNTPRAGGHERISMGMTLNARDQVKSVSKKVNEQVAQQ